MKYLKLVALLLAVLLVITVIYQYPKLNIIAGYAAKNMASTVYIANRTARSVNNKDHKVPLIELAETRLNRASRSATSNVFGLMERTAVFREGLGSVLVQEDYTEPDMFLIPERNIVKHPSPFPFGDAIQEDTIFSGCRLPAFRKGAG